MPSFTLLYLGPRSEGSSGCLGYGVRGRGCCHKVNPPPCPWPIPGGIAVTCEVTTDRVRSGSSLSLQIWVSPPLPCSVFSLGQCVTASFRLSTLRSTLSSYCSPALARLPLLASYTLLLLQAQHANKPETSFRGTKPPLHSSPISFPRIRMQVNQGERAAENSVYNSSMGAVDACPVDNTYLIL